jgi:molybdenum cofactor biosynthesis enzyme MoaA
MKPNRPSKLMRIEICSFCDYKCKFCCWENQDYSKDSTPLPPSFYRALGRALVKTGCYNINLTGGEPLLMDLGYLTNVIREIKSVGDIRQLWITTNGERLRDQDLCKALYAAGLRDIALSVAAETDEKYREYAGVDIGLSDILTGVKNAISQGITVRAHIPLNPTGTHTFDEVNLLLGKLKLAGVWTAFYFRLHNSDKLTDEYKNLYIDPKRITKGFETDPAWSFRRTDTGRPCYTDGKMTVYVPRDEVSLVTDNCKKQDCGDFCQGIYSIYLVPKGKRWIVRGCHRIFKDGRNEYEIPEGVIESEDIARLADILNQAWRYAYED